MYFHSFVWVYLDVKINARKETNIKSPETGKPLEWDVWIPNLQIIFEYQVSISFLKKREAIREKQEKKWNNGGNEKIRNNKGEKIRKERRKEKRKEDRKEERK